MTFLDNYKPDIYVGSTNDSVLGFISHKSKVLILINYLEKIIIYNGIVIKPQLSDVREELITRALDNPIDFYIGDTKTRSELADCFHKSHHLISSAYCNIIKRLVFEFIMQYHDNPTVTATSKKDNKTQLFELVTNLQKQLDEMKNLIDSME